MTEIVKTIRLTALLAAMAIPAWAANDTKDADRQAAYNDCRDAGGNMHLCGIMHAPSEEEARDAALRAMTFCAGPALNIYAIKNCGETRAYIKARWGY